jgi:hypothetical protein
MAQCSQQASTDTGSENATLASVDLPTELAARGIVVIRLGHGANCSSIGSNVDLLYAGAAAAGALLTAVAVGLRAHTEARDVAGGEAQQTAATSEADDARGPPTDAPPSGAAPIKLPEEPR